MSGTCVRHTWRGGRNRRATVVRVTGVVRPDGAQPAEQLTVGQVVLPFFWMVTPQLLPLPFGLATSVCASG
ncbi:hypothetical protein GCM10018787_07300 [Streptomyces thermodiastaticus]|nr:hypothetical protein GCM10018787_07300 [Streptomyces thermodiastaticus]